MVKKTRKLNIKEELKKNYDEISERKLNKMMDLAGLEEYKGYTRKERFELLNIKMTAKLSDLRYKGKVFKIKTKDVDKNDLIWKIIMKKVEIYNEPKHTNYLKHAEQVEKKELIYQITGNATNYRQQLPYETYNSWEKVFPEIKKKITEKHKEKRITNYIILFFQHKNSKTLRRVSLPSSIIKAGEQVFIDFIEGMSLGTSVEGSDILTEEEYTPIYNVFDMVTYKQARGNGVSELNMNFIYEVEPLESKNKMCGHVCLKKILGDRYILNDEEYIKKELYYMKNLKKYILDNKYPIDVVNNSIRLNTSLNIEILFEGEGIEINKTKYKNKIDYLYPLTKNNIDGYDYCYQSSAMIGVEAERKIIYNSASKHFGVLKEPQIMKEIFLSYKGDHYYKNGEEYKTFEKASDEYINKKKLKIEKAEQPNKQRYLSLDYETVCDWDHQDICIPYSACIIDVDEEELLNIITLDKKNDDKSKKELDKIRNKNGHFFAGFDCTEQIMNYIDTHDENVSYSIVTFNGANFDHLIFYQDLMALGVDHISDPLFVGTSLLNFTIKGKHDFFDIRKHLGGSLAYNCSEFKLNLCGKTSFDHHKAQDLFEKGELIDFITKDDEVKNYNISDCMANLGLLATYQQQLKLMPTFAKYADNIHKIKTGPALMWKTLENNIETLDIKCPILKGKLKKWYDKIFEDKTGGRNQTFNGMQIIKGKLVSLDVCSLYPYVMAIYDKSFFPHGEVIEVSKPEDIPEGKIYFFECIIDQSNFIKNGVRMAPNILTQKIEGYGNDWDYKGKITQTIPDVTIKLLLDFGCKIEYVKGHYYTEKIEGCKLFSFLLELMKIKNTQDVYIKEGSSLANNALRAIVKNLSNSLSGKCIEGFHLDAIKCFSEAQYDTMCNKNEEGKITNLNPIKKIGNNIIASYTKDKEQAYTKGKPIYFGSLIYAYSKDYFYRHILSKIPYEDLIYTDTDSVKIKEQPFNKWNSEYGCKVNVPHFKEIEEIDERYKEHKLYSKSSKVYGSLEDECEQLDTYLSVFVDKKQYCTLGYMCPPKSLFKGISKYDKITENEFDESKYSNKELVEIHRINKESLIEKSVKYEKEIKELKAELKNYDKDTEEYKTVYEKIKNLSIENNKPTEELFMTLYNDREISFLTMALTRDVRNKRKAKDEQGINDNKLNEISCSIHISARVKRMRIKTPEELEEYKKKLLIKQNDKCYNKWVVERLKYFNTCKAKYAEQVKKNKSDQKKIAKIFQKK